jgi:hypothetical protein
MTPSKPPLSHGTSVETNNGERAGYILVVAMCLLAVTLILLMPAESMFTDLVYRAF